MPELQEKGPYIYPTWLPKLLAGLDRCEWKVWFQVQHGSKSWEKLNSDFNLTRYNIEHTELLRLCTDDYQLPVEDPWIRYHDPQTARTARAGQRRLMQTRPAQGQSPVAPSKLDFGRPAPGQAAGLRSRQGSLQEVL